MGDLICTCLHVREGEIVAAIREGARSLDEIDDRCDAGSGCGSCHDGIREILREQLLRLDAMANQQQRSGRRQLKLFDGE